MKKILMSLALAALSAVSFAAPTADVDCLHADFSQAS